MANVPITAPVSWPPTLPICSPATASRLHRRCFSAASPPLLRHFSGGPPV